MSWADKFFENSWLRIARHNSTTGALEVNGSAITGVASGTWVEFVALTVDELLDLDQMVYHVTDVHCNAAGIGGSYFARDASPPGWGQISGPLYYATLAAAPSAVTWPHLRIFAANVGISGAVMRSDGTYYRTESSRVPLYNLTADIVNPSTFVEYLFAAATIPIDINTKSLLQTGDYLEIKQYMEKVGLVDKFTRTYRFGQTNGIAETAVNTVTDSGVGNRSRGDYLMQFQRRSATSMRIRGYDQGVPAGGSSATTHAAAVPVDNIDAATTYFILSGMLTSVGGTDSAHTLMDYEVTYCKGF